MPKNSWGTRALVQPLPDNIGTVSKVRKNKVGADPWTCDYVYRVTLTTRQIGSGIAINKRNIRDDISMSRIGILRMPILLMLDALCNTTLNHVTLMQ